MISQHKITENDGQIVCFGEVLIDMVAASTGTLSQASSFLKKFGGAPANTAVGLARLGIPVTFIGKVGRDSFGAYLESVFKKEGVNTSLLAKDHQQTTLAFVSLDKNGQRDFIFYNGSHESISKNEILLPENTKILHFGSLTQINNPAKQATEKILSIAAKKGVIISYDPNIREFLWKDLRKAKETILVTAKKVNFLKINEDESFLLTGERQPERAANRLFLGNIEAIIITLGSKGCYFRSRKYKGHIPTIKTIPIDTTGAGDAFNAGYLAGIYRSKKQFTQMSFEDIISLFKKANIIASITTTKKGAITAFPREKTVASYL